MHVSEEVNKLAVWPLFGFIEVIDDDIGEIDKDHDSYYKGRGIIAFNFSLM